MTNLKALITAQTYSPSYTPDVDGIGGELTPERFTFDVEYLDDQDVVVATEIFEFNGAITQDDVVNAIKATGADILATIPTPVQPDPVPNPSPIDNGFEVII